MISRANVSKFITVRVDIPPYPVQLSRLVIVTGDGQRISCVIIPATSGLCEVRR